MNQEDTKEAIGAIAELALVNTGKIDAQTAVLKALVATLAKGMPTLAVPLDANIAIIAKSIERADAITPQQVAGDHAFEATIDEFRSLLAKLKPN